MNSKALLYYVLGAASLIAAAYFFFRWLDWKFLLPLVLALAGVICFWKGSVESKRK
jgi:hypothetical protein